jgi:hypothetical protein
VGIVDRSAVVAACAAVWLSAPQGPTFEPYQPDLASSATLTNAAADFDNDGDVDLFVGFNGAANRLYRNDRGVLTDVASASGVADARSTRATAWGDYDADGDPDLLVGFAPGDAPVLRLYRNESGRFQDATGAAGLIVATGAVRQPVWIDADGDGDLDLFVAFRDRPNTFFRNDGGRFTDVAATIGLADPRKTVGAVWFDYEQDGDLDLYVANQDGDANGLFRSEGGRFTDVAEAAGVAWAGRAPREAKNGTVRPCVADVDGDSRFDIFAANYGPNGLFVDGGSGTFADESSARGIAVDGRYDTCAFADYDNDGRIDVFVNGTLSGGVSFRDYLFHNAGKRFEDATPPLMLAASSSHGVLWADFDGDGDEDLALAGLRPDERAGDVTVRRELPLVWRNLLRRGRQRWLDVKVVDSRGRSTLAGAEVRTYAPGTRNLLGTRLVDAGSGYNAQSDVPVHFGVGTMSRVDVEVLYPAAGRREIVRAPGVETGQTQPLVIKLPARMAGLPPQGARMPDVIFVPTRESVADEMLTLAGITARDVVYDLGSGDGRIVMLAAQKYGARGVGIEIDPKLVATAKEVAKIGEAEDRVTFIEGDLFEVDISAATLVTLYLSPMVNARLEPKLRAELRAGTRIVSHQFPIGKWAADKTVQAEDGTMIYLYTVRKP